MDNFDEFIRDKSQYKEARTERYKYDSKDRLSKILKKKVQTTMIGAISSIEDHFAFLWTAEDSEMTTGTGGAYGLFVFPGTVDHASDNTVTTGSCMKPFRRSDLKF